MSLSLSLPVSLSLSQMLSGGYFGVISPEGAASILGRYKDDAHKAQQFPIGERLRPIEWSNAYIDK